MILTIRDGVKSMDLLLGMRKNSRDTKGDTPEHTVGREGLMSESATVTVQYII